MESRETHLNWCKERANQYIEMGNLQEAFASMMSDLRKHPSTEMHPAIMLGMQLLMTGNLSTTEQMRHFINGFN